MLSKLSNASFCILSFFLLSTVLLSKALLCFAFVDAIYLIFCWCNIFQLLLTFSGHPIIKNFFPDLLLSLLSLSFCNYIQISYYNLYYILTFYSFPHKCEPCYIPPSPAYTFFSKYFHLPGIANMQCGLRHDQPGLTTTSSFDLFAAIGQPLQGFQVLGLKRRNSQSEVELDGAPWGPICVCNQNIYLLRSAYECSLYAFPITLIIFPFFTYLNSNQHTLIFFEEFIL